ncbi:MAG: winged helix-turn-helix domain-containing protein, partial [Pseudomonadota bacterium]
YGKTIFDPKSCTVYYEDCKVHLNPKEYALLEVFIRYPTHVLSYDAIIDRVWEGESIPTRSCIRTHIKRLRKAFNAVNYPGEIVENIHGLGYRLAPLSTSETGVIRPPSGVLQRFFKSKAIEYLVLDNQLLVQYLSPGLTQYSDYPAEVQLKGAASDGFPEFVGLEDTFQDILQGKRESFEICGVGKGENPDRPDYINFYAIADRSTKSANRLFVFFEDAADQMRSRQRLVQRSNETMLLLERLQMT